MVGLKQHIIKEAWDWHIENDMPITENIFRPHSEMNYELFRVFREAYEAGDYTPKNLFEQQLLETDIGTFGVFEGKKVPLDFPLMEDEEKNVELNKPKRGGSKKFYVYVRDPETKNIKKVEFGDTTGLKVKIDDPEARKSFAARHNCDAKKDKTKPGYWACNLPRYGKALGLSVSGNFYW